MGRRIWKKKTKDKKENFSIELVKNIDENLDNIKKMLEDPSDLVIREFIIDKRKKCGIVYIDGMVDSMLINNNIMRNLQVDIKDYELPEDPQALFEQIYMEILSVSSIKKGETMDDLSLALLSGDTIFYLDGMDQVLIIDTKQWESRAIEEPETETLIRGPREGFVEDIQKNLMLIRRSIRDPNLRFKNYQMGRRAKKNLVVTYIDGVINPDILKEVNRRLATIDIDDAPDSSYIEEWIEDNYFSPFPQVMTTERPDKVTAAISQGKVAILLDGTPIVLIVPATLASEMHSPEDYYYRWSIGSLLRVLRYTAAFIAMFLPALYIALVSFHQGMIPSELAFSIAGSREGVPFPPFIEALLMAVTMELLREAGVRLPAAIGQTIGIVGGLVIGDAAVSAGLVSPVMVIVIALNAIASFALPSYNMAAGIRINMFAFMVAASLLGLYGIVLAYIMVNIHLVNLKSVGVPYSSPFAPTFFNDWKDLVLRVPIYMMKDRPKYLKTEDTQRIKEKE